MNLVSRFYREDEPLRRKVRDLAHAPGALVLDVGCRRGDVTRTLARDKGFVAGLDLRPHEDWRDSSGSVQFVCGSATALPFRKECADLVVSTECLQYIPDWKGALDEMRGVLKKDGRLVLSCPNGVLLNRCLDPQYVVHHLRRLVSGQGREKGFVHHLSSRDILRHCSVGWRCDTVRLSGSLAFIYVAFLIDFLQSVRRRGLAGGRGSRLLAEWAIRPWIKLLFRAMRIDFSLPLGRFSYNCIYRFEKLCPPEASSTGTS